MFGSIGGDALKAVVTVGVQSKTAYYQTGQSMSHKSNRLVSKYPNTCPLLNRFVLTIGAIGSATPMRPQKEPPPFYS